MPAGEYFVTRYSTQIKILVRLLLRMKIDSSKILREAYSLFNGEKNLDAVKTKILYLEKKIKLTGIELEDSVNKIIALSHPVAFDLRFLLSSIKISAELSYIANWIKKSVQSFTRLESEKFFDEDKKDLLKMLELSIDTLKDVISTLLQFDSKKKADREILLKIEEMLKKDDIVDEIYENLLQHSLSSIKETKANPIKIFELMSIAKNLEKVLDCIHNMIITTRYVLTGQRI